MTIRARKAFKSIVKRHQKHGYQTSFTELSLFNKIAEAVTGGICPYCFGPLTWDNFSPDHMDPLERKGSPHLPNIEIVCARCNKEKASHLQWNPKYVSPELHAQKEKRERDTRLGW